MHTSLTALGQQLLDVQLVAPKLILEVFNADTRSLRGESYRSRLDADMREARSLIQAFMKDFPPEGLDREQALRSLERHYDLDAPGFGRLPPDHTHRSFLDHLITRGALAETHDPDKDDQPRLACPIPSFHQFLANGFRLGPQARQAQRIVSVHSPPPPGQEVR